MEENQVVISEEELQGLLQKQEDVIEDIIPFSVDVVGSYEEFSHSNDEEYDKGVKEASVYVGQFHTLINAGMSSELATVVMSWIREDKLNKEAIDMQLEVAKQEALKVKRETL